MKKKRKVNKTDPHISTSSGTLSSVHYDVYVAVSV